MAFVPIHILRARAEQEERVAEEKLKAEEDKKEAEKDPDVWRGTVEQAMKQLHACKSLGLMSMVRTSSLIDPEQTDLQKRRRVQQRNDLCRRWRCAAVFLSSCTSVSTDAAVFVRRNG